MQVFTVTEADTGKTHTYRSTTKAWSDAELRAMLMEAGFSAVARCPQWPCNTDILALWSARRETGRLGPFGSVARRLLYAPRRYATFFTRKQGSKRPAR